MKAPKTVEYDSIKWTRQPESESRPHRVYYQGYPDKKTPTYLHRYIWEKNKGPIPEGHIIHHIDGDSMNNDLNNLNCIPLGEHSKHHYAEYWDDPENQETHLKHLDEIRSQTIEWHRSEEGKTWHRDQYQKTLGNKRIEKTFTCEVCGIEFKKTTAQKNIRFCSIKCGNSILRYDRICTICGKKFTITRTQRRRQTCSKECSSLLRSKRYKERTK